MIQFKSTTTPESEQILAHTLGYPKSWHVVRKCPHPILQKPNTFQDLIYAGDPQIADMYFNHTAAMNAAMKWKGEDDEVGDGNIATGAAASTPFDDDGGQLLPMEGGLVQYWEEGDEVEVYYDGDRKWHRATIIEVMEYRDDQRYTVQYTVDEGTQANICHEKLREIKKSSNKKRKASSLSSNKNDSSSPSTQGSTTKRSRTSMNSSSSKVISSSAKHTKTTTSPSPSVEVPAYKTTFTPNYVADTRELELGSKMGLPEGWAVNIKPNSRFTFHSPEGERFTSKKAVYTHLGLPMPKHGYNPLNDNNDDDNDYDNEQEEENNNSGDENSDEEEEGNDLTTVEEGDPPWRTKDHKYLGKRIEYTFPDGITGKGTITGWIAKTDVDKDGNPGFISERTNEAACLFHVTMDANCAVESQDFEEYEVEECLI